MSGKDKLISVEHLKWNVGGIKCGTLTVDYLNWILDHEEPAVDAEPVRHGKWIIRDNPGTGWYRVTCSECGEDVTANAPCIGFFPNAKVIWNYCPECGADMRGEKDG